MAMQDHLELYDSFNGQQLAEEHARLMEARKGFVSQQAGSKSYTQDLKRVDDQLSAVVRIQNMRKTAGGGRGNAMGVVDFSRMS